MSHIVQIKTQVRDATAVQAACARLKLKPPWQGTAKLFAESATGLMVELPEWRYPVVFDLTSGEVKFDNYQGHWGQQAQLDKFLQSYAAEKTKLAARRQGHAVTEQTLPDGSIKLTIAVGGGV
jgi:hypothetical protein